MNRSEGYLNIIVHGAGFQAHDAASKSDAICAAIEIFRSATQGTMLIACVDGGGALRPIGNFEGPGSAIDRNQQIAGLPPRRACEDGGH